MSLQDRTKRSFYDEWAKVARRAGLSEAEIEAHVSDSISTIESLIVNKCPKCGQPIARYVNYERQQGPSNMAGAWVMYRCSTQPPPGQSRRSADTCDFMMDLKEPEASN